NLSNNYVMGKFMRKKSSNEKLIKKNKYKLTSCFALIVLSIIIVSNANTAYATNSGQNRFIFSTSGK
ncbi:unnamed protein product, partial [marine sediment metagenome]